MRTRSAYWIVGMIATIVVLVGCGDGRTQSEGQNEFEEAVAELTLAYVAAVNSEDAKAYAALLDEDVVQLPPDAPARSGREAVKEAMAEVFAVINFEEFAVSNHGIQRIGDYGFFWGTHSYVMIPWAGGDTTRFDGKHLSVMKRQSDGTWLGFRDCFNSNVPTGN